MEPHAMGRDVPQPPEQIGHGLRPIFDEGGLAACGNGGHDKQPRDEVSWRTRARSGRSTRRATQYYAMVRDEGSMPDGRSLVQGSPSIVAGPPAMTSIVSRLPFKRDVSMN